MSPFPVDPAPTVRLEVRGVRPRITAPRFQPRLDVQSAATAADPASVAGGWRPRHAKGCALAIGMSVAGVAGVLVNPIGGYIAYHIGYTMALLACT